MHILYIHQYFNTPQEPGGTRSYWISKELVRRGHRVTMITSTNAKLHPEPCEMDVDGIHVIYVKNDYSNYMSAPRKVLSFLNFIRLAVKAGAKVKDVDIMYATSTPLTVGYIAMRLKKRMGWPYVFEVRDLWPEFPIQVGAIKNKLAIKYLRRLERKIYQRSEFVVALSPGMQEGVVSAGMPKEKTAMIPNMSKPDKFFPHEKNAEVAERFGIDLTKFNVVHFGSMGRANGLEYIINAAKALKDRGDDSIRFVFMGKKKKKFNPFTFNVIIDKEEFTSYILLFIFSVFYTFFVLHFLQCCLLLHLVDFFVANCFGPFLISFCIFFYD